MRYGLPVVSVLAALVAFAPSQRSEAAEGGVSDYILGSRGPGAGITPPPGVYFDNTTWYYDGKIGGNRALPTGGLLVANVSQQTWLNISTPLWVTPVNLFGANLAFSASIPVGEPRIGAGLLVNSPVFGPIGRQVTDANTNLSDIFVQSFLGWNAGNLHWQLGVGGVIPSGTYVSGQLSNASLNRPAVDLFGTVTWLDPALGVDLSAAAGFMFNQTNTATDYKTGDEFHLEWAATKYLTKEFTIGLVGYYYQQLTADSGTGARLGSFEGRVVALGGSIGYTFEVGKLPISTRLKIYREFAVQNRFEGTSGFFSVSLPIGLDTNAPPPKPIAVKF